MIAFCILCLILACLFIIEENKEKYVAAVVLKGLASISFFLTNCPAPAPKKASIISTTPPPSRNVNPQQARAAASARFIAL